MKIVVGQRYVDGWGEEHTIVGAVPSKPGQFWSNTGYRWLEDGRMQMRVVPDRTRFDLVDPDIKTEDQLEEEMEAESYARVPEQHCTGEKPHNHTVCTDEQQNRNPL